MTAANDSQVTLGVAVAFGVTLPVVLVIIAAVEVHFYRKKMVKRPKMSDIQKEVREAEAVQMEEVDIEP